MARETVTLHIFVEWSAEAAYIAYELTAKTSVWVTLVYMILFWGFFFFNGNIFQQ